MSNTMRLLLEHAWSKHLPRYLGHPAHKHLEELEARNLDKLRLDLSAAQLEILEKYQDACRAQQALEPEAMFQAAFSVARELR